MRGRFMGDVYYYTELPQGGEGRGVGRERQNIPLSLPLIQKPHRGWRALSHSHGGGRGSCFCTEMLNLVRPDTQHLHFKLI